MESGRRLGLKAIYGYANDQSLHGILKYQGRSPVGPVPLALFPVRPFAAIATLMRKRPSTAANESGPPEQPGWSRPAFHEGHTDLFRHADDLLPIAIARGERAHGVMALAMPGTPHRRRLRRLGFIGVPRALRPETVTLTVKPLETDPEKRTGWLEPSNWYLTFGDGELV